MTVAVAHHVSAISETVLAEAIKEAGFRRTDLVLINVTDSLDLDKREALEVGIGDVVEKLAPGEGLQWRIEVAAAGNDGSEIAAQIQLNGATYMIPVVNFVYPVFVNLDLMAAAGIENPPASRTEFADAAAKLTDAANNVSGLGCP